MKKQTLLKFISKYNLLGLAESVKWTIKDKSLTTKFTIEDRTLIGKVVMKNFDLQDSEIGIPTTSELQQILNVSEDDIKVDMKDYEGKFVNVVIDDRVKKLSYVLAETDVIPNPGSIKTEPEYEIVINSPKKLIETYLHSFPGVVTDIVGIKSDGSQVEFILGYSNINTNRISFKLDANITSDINVIPFNSMYLKNIFLVNRDMEKGKISISSQGLMKIQFLEKDYQSEYYLVQLQGS